MKIQVAYPPNYDVIVKAFGPIKKNVLFAWGDTIFMPQARAEIDLGLVRHETVHGRQQKKVGGPENWWAKYLTDPEFRIDQEVEAYRAQLQFYALKLPRKVLRMVELAISKEMSGPMYGRMMTRQQAIAALRGQPWRPERPSAPMPRLEPQPDPEPVTPAMMLDDQDAWWVRLMGGVRKAVLR